MEGKYGMAQLLLLYSTVDGHTLEICERLQALLATDGHAVSIAELTPGGAVELNGYDAVVLGASIRYGKHRPEVARFIEDHREYLEKTPSAFFSVNAVARKPEKQTPETNPYVRKFLQTISWRPRTIGIFGGKIDYPSYGFVDKHMIRFIMWMTKGPTDPNGTFDFTDWGHVEAFSTRVKQMLKDARPG